MTDRSDDLPGLCRAAAIQELSADAGLDGASNALTAMIERDRAMKAEAFERIADILAVLPTADTAERVAIVLRQVIKYGLGVHPPTGERTESIRSRDRGAIAEASELLGGLSCFLDREG